MHLKTKHPLVCVFPIQTFKPTTYNLPHPPYSIRALHATHLDVAALTARDAHSLETFLALQRMLLDPRTLRTRIHDKTLDPTALPALYGASLAEAEACLGEVELALAYAHVTQVLTAAVAEPDADPDSVTTEQAARWVESCGALPLGPSPALRALAAKALATLNRTMNNNPGSGAGSAEGEGSGGEVLRVEGTELWIGPPGPGVEGLTECVLSQQAFFFCVDLPSPIFRTNFFGKFPVPFLFFADEVKVNDTNAYWVYIYALTLRFPS